MRWLVLLLAACLVGGCRREEPAAPVPVAPVHFDGAEALAECEAFVSLGPKPAGSEAARRAADHIRGRLASYGIATSLDEFEDEAPGGRVRFQNVIGFLPGNPDRIIILGAHYDTKTGISDTFAGANDSGSGVGLLLALAKTLKGVPAAGGFEIRFTFLDGEECRREYGPRDGLHGSRRMVRQLRERGEAKKVLAFILLDMVGDRNLGVTIPRNGTPELIRRVMDAAKAEGVRGRFSLYPGAILDDHQPFLEAGIPAVDLIDFQYGPADGRNEYWHTDADTLDKLDAASLGTVGRVVLRVLSSFGFSYSRPCITQSTHSGRRSE